MLRKLSVVIAIVAAAWVSACAQAPSERGGIGYPTPAAVFEALRARDDVAFSVVDGWMIAEDRNAKALWSFTPPNHPAHPAVVKRAVVTKPDTIGIHMSVLCAAPKPACDKLVADFRELNERIRNSSSRQLSL